LRRATIALFAFSRVALFLMG